ncbi:MAG: double zinc ribbon domain-containing protein, partial [Luteolibacter sp.]
MQTNFSTIGSRLAQASRWLGARAIDLLYPSDCVLCSDLLTSQKALCESCASDLP